MLQWWKNRVSQSRKADHVYDGIIAQSRHPEFYTRFGVPDTIDGRYELIILHLFLVMERLRDHDAKVADVARRTLERFVEDMDDCMREQGVSDLKVPKKVKQAAAGFYERATMLRDCISSEREMGSADVADETEAYFRNVFETASDADENNPTAKAQVFADALARYTNAASEMLAKQSVPALVDDGPIFPHPAKYLADRRATD